MKSYRLKKEVANREETGKRSAVVKPDRQSNGRIVGFGRGVLVRVYGEREREREKRFRGEIRVEGGEERRMALISLEMEKWFGRSR